MGEVHPNESDSSKVIMFKDSKTCWVGTWKGMKLM
jgi:hypothetical protein